MFLGRFVSPSRRPLPVRCTRVTASCFRARTCLHSLIVCVCGGGGRCHPLRWPVPSQRLHVSVSFPHGWPFPCSPWPSPPPGASVAQIRRRQRMRVRHCARTCPLSPSLVAPLRWRSFPNAPAAPPAPVPEKLQKRENPAFTKQLSFLSAEKTRLEAEVEQLRNQLHERVCACA